MGPLEKLREDVKVALRDGRPSKGRLFDSDHAALAVIDAFCKEYEAVEVWRTKPIGAEPGGWLEAESTGLAGSVVCITILVPRKRKPTLREAAEAVATTWSKNAASYNYEEVKRSMDALATALQEEER